MTNKKKGIYTITVISLIVFLTFGTIPVSAASKSNKPGKPTISTEVTETTSEHVRVVVKIDKTKNAEGFEIYDKLSGDKEYKKVVQLKKSGEQSREYTIDYPSGEKKVSIKVRAYKGSVYGKYSAISKINLSAYTTPTKTKKSITPEKTISSKSMALTVGFSRSDSNNIGNEWTYEYKLNGVNVKGNGEKYDLKIGDKIIVEATITENDKYPDVGKGSITHTVTEDDLKNGFKVSFDVTVKENGGRYAGKTADFNVVFKFKP